MESLADSGNGNYAYIDTLKEAKKALVTEIAGTLYSIANDVKIQIGFNPAAVDSYRLIGYENRLLRTEDFADDRKDAGEMGAGHSVTVLYELVLQGTAAVAATKLRYQTSEVREDAQGTGELLLIKFRYKSPGESQSRFLEQPILFDPLPLIRTLNQSLPIRSCPGSVSCPRLNRIRFSGRVCCRLKRNEWNRWWIWR